MFQIDEKDGNLGKGRESHAQVFTLAVMPSPATLSGNPIGTARLRMINRANPLRVLLVDDENYMRVFVGRVLSSAIKCTISEARDGQDAIEQCGKAEPELIILDINMPRVDGVQALGQIRALKPDTPIVMLTSISEEAVVEECVTKGASYFIRKDVRADLLKTELEEMLKQFFPEEKATP
jgi:two-component system chemotaxis response regulator CheY